MTSPVPPDSAASADAAEADLRGVADEAALRLGATLVTITVITPRGDEVARIFSTHPEVYPCGGRKRLDPSQTSPIWLDRVVARQLPFLGATRERLREFFFDWATIERLGCGAIVNTPVVRGGRTIGSVNFLAPEGKLDETSVGTAMEITREAAPAVAAAAALAFPDAAVADGPGGESGR